MDNHQVQVKCPTCHCLLVIRCDGPSPHPSGVPGCQHDFDVSFDVRVATEYPHMIRNKCSEAQQSNSQLQPLRRCHGIATVMNDFELLAFVDLGGMCVAAGAPAQACGSFCLDGSFAGS